MYSNKLQNATIRWFDSTSGEGYVRLENGVSVFVHFTAFEGISKNNHHWPTNEDQLKLQRLQGRSCMVSVDVGMTFAQVEKLILT